MLDDEIIDDLRSEGDLDGEIVEDEEEDGGKKKEDKSDDAKRAEKAERHAKSLEKKYAKAVERIQTLEKKKDTDKGLSEEEKKELAAEQYIRKIIKREQAELEEEQARKEKEKIEAMEDELDEVLSENDDVSEDDIMSIVDDLKVTPKQALKIFKAYQKKEGEEKKEKKGLPKSKRSATKVEDKDAKENPYEGKDTHEIWKLAGDSAKKALKEMTNRK